MFGEDNTNQIGQAARAGEAKISAHTKPAVYQIRIRGHLGYKWTDYFEDFSITLEKGGDTILTGVVIDQAMLHGLFKKIRDLGLVLISVGLADESSIEETDESGTEATDKSSAKEIEESDLKATDELKTLKIEEEK